jgi:diguanylate cyclase (GGDEF)-like protein/hemerythrin-like metal-binding protein/PAS domain S-box-containing protein
MTRLFVQLTMRCDALQPGGRHALALTLFAAALLLRSALFPVDADAEYLTFYPAVASAFLLFGTGPGIVVALLSAATTYYAFSPPFMSWEQSRVSVIAAGLFLLGSGLIGLLSHAFGATRREAQAGERRFASFLDDQADLFCRYKADGTIIHVNDAYCRDFGVTRAEVISHKWQPVAWPEDVPHVLAQLATLRPDNPVVTIENRVVTKGKGVVWRQFVNRAFFDAQGNITELQSVGRDIHERKLLAQRLEGMASQLQDLYDHAPCGYHSLDEQGLYLNMNQTELDWLGCARDELVGRHGPGDFTTEEGREIFRRLFPVLKQTGRIDNLEFDLVGKNGSTRRVSINATVLRGADGCFLCTRTVTHDITARARDEARIAAESARFKAFLRVATDGVHILDAQARLVEASDSFCNMLGYTREELLGARPSFWDARGDGPGLDGLTGQVQAGKLQLFEASHRRKDGTFVDVEVHAKVFHYERGRYLFCASRDISGRKRDERRIVHMATHDPLTGLPNRMLFRDRLSRSLAQAQRRGKSGALLVLDLDGFKVVNDRYGHEAGDKALKVVASRLNALVRDSDSVARIGGDEFAIVLDDICGEAAIRALADEVMQSVARPLVLDNGILVALGASVGVAPFPAAGRSRRTLLAAADRAMYASKFTGRNTCTISAEDGGIEDSGALLFDAVGLPRTGLASMDQAHDELANLVTGVGQAMDAGADRAQLLQKLDEMTALSSRHFREEDQWMAQFNYPDAEAHVLAHRQLLEELAVLKSGLCDGNDSSLPQMLKDWIVIHIGAFDGPLAQYIADHPGRAVPGQAAI